MTQPQTFWVRIMNSRFLAVIGIVALFFVGGAVASSMAQAQSYTTATATVSTTDLTLMQQQIQALNNRVSILENQMRALLGAAPRQTTAYVPPRQTTYTAPAPSYTAASTYSATVYSPTTANPIYTTTTYPNYPTIQPVTVNNTVVARPVTIDQNGGTYVGGFDMYFTGRGFTPYEQILISRNGIVVGHATVDPGGSFSSGGVFLPYGTNTFTFAGQTSGVNSVATVLGVNNVASP
jgi:hypothetical protein